MRSPTRTLLRPAELRWALSVGAALMVLTVLPYVYAWCLTPPGQQYLWLLYNPDEPNVHLSWIRQAADGQWLLRDACTTGPQQASFLNLFMLGLGRLARVTRLQPVFVYHLARIVSGTALCVALYWFASLLTPRLEVRRLCLLLAGTASGLGWAAPWLNQGLGTVGLPLLNPPDFGMQLCMPEAITFLSLYLYPLFSTSMLLLVLSLGLYLLSDRLGWMRYAVASGLVALLLGNFHTYDLFPLYLTLLLWCLYRLVETRRGGAAVLARAAVVVSCSAPSLVYQYWTFQHNAIFRAKALTVTAPPPPRDLLAAYGFLVPLALLGAWVAWRSRRQEARFATCWVVAAVSCLCLPVSFQRKMIEGLHLPVCFLAALALGSWLPVVLNRRRWRGPVRRAANRVLWGFSLLAMVPSNVAFVGMTLQLAATNNLTRASVAQPPYYLGNDELAALRWLDAHSSNDAVVLSAPYAGSYIPGLSGNTVYAGHWAETLNFETKLGAVGRFYAGRMSSTEAADFLSAGRVQYVYYGAYERALSQGVAPAYPFLTPLYPAEGTPLLYRVQLR